MKKKNVVACVAVLLLSAGVIPAAEPKSDAGYKPRVDKDGWEILFDGKDLAAWNVDPKAGVWAINAAGELLPAKGGPTIFTRRRYCDYILELDFKMADKKKSNSGVFIGVHDPNHEVYTGMEIQILDNADYNVTWNAMNANGALYGLVRPGVDANKPMGQWNHFRITARDASLTIELNGKSIVKADLSKWTTPHKNPDGGGNKFPHAIGSLPREGFIGLQNYGGKALWFRNVRIKPLSDRKPKFTGKEPIADVLKKPAASPKTELQLIAANPGLKELTGDSTPLKAGQKIAIYGDSITMQGGYITMMSKALAMSDKTRGLKVKLFKHGLDGGRVPTVLAGKSPWGKLGGTMAELLDREKADLVVIFLGINDVWHGKKGTSPADFRSGLKKMVEMARRGGGKVVLATPTMIGEKPGGKNPFDKQLDEYARITRDLAGTEKCTLVDLRKVFTEYIEKHNTKKDAKGNFPRSKILTYDGVHMLPAGNDLIAQYVSKGILDALKAAR